MLVVAVAILRNGCVLAAERAYPPELAGQWEFPGGKAGDGEDEAAAAVRECAEELGVVVHLEGRLGPDAHTAAGHPLHLWTATLAAGEPHAREHRALRWLTPDELSGVSWIPADLPLVVAVEARLRGAERGTCTQGRLGGSAVKIPSIKLVLAGLTAAAVVEQLRRPDKERDWHGTIAGIVPYDFRPPTAERLRATYWAPETDELFRPHVFGVGWGLNVGRLVKVYRDQLAARVH